MKRKRKRQASPQVFAIVSTMTREGYGAAAIHRALEDEGWPGMSHGLDVRTIQRMAKDVDDAEPDTSGPWSLVDAAPGEARLVGDVAAFVADATSGRLWLTRELAQWVATIRGACPDVPAAWAYALARAYRTLDKHPEPRNARPLDLVLSARPWQSPERAAWFQRMMHRVEHDIGALPRGLWVDMAALMDTRPGAPAGSFGTPWPETTTPVSTPKPNDGGRRS